MSSIDSDSDYDESYFDESEDSDLYYPEYSIRIDREEEKHS